MSWGIKHYPGSKRIEIKSAQAGWTYISPQGQTECISGCCGSWLMSLREALCHLQSVIVVWRGFWWLEKGKGHTALFIQDKKVGLGNIRLVSLTSFCRKIMMWVLLGAMSTWMKENKVIWGMDLATANHIWPTGLPSVISCINKKRAVNTVYLSLARPSGQSSIAHLQPDWWDIDSTAKLYSRWKTFRTARLTM